MSGSLKSGLKLTVAMSLALLLLQGGLSYLILENLRSAIRESVDKQQFALVQTLAREVDHKIAAHLRLMTRIAAEVPEEALSDPRAARAFLASQRHRTVFDHGFFLFTPQGALVGTTGLRETGPYREAVLQAAAKRAPLVSPPLRSPADGDPVVIFCAPVIAADGEVKGVLGGAFCLLHDNFLSNIAQAKIGKTGYLYLFDQQRTLLVHPKKERILERIVPPKNNLLFDRALGGFQGTMETVNSQGVLSVASCTALKEAPWFLAATFPSREAYASLTAAREHLLGAMLLTFAGSGLALTVIGASMRKEVRQRAQAEDHADLLLRSVGEGVVGVTQQGKIDFVNDATVSLLGYRSATQLLGKDVRELLHHDRPDCPNCTKEKCPIAPVFAAGGVLRSENETMVRRDGSTLTADFSCTPVLANGSQKGSVVTFKDVTERRKTEEQLRVVSAALETAANSILITDRESRIVWVNRSFTRSTGYAPEDVVGRNPAELLSAGGDDAALRELGETIGGKKPWHGELTARRRDGTTYDEDVTITPVLDQNGEITNFIGIMQDITERKLAEEALVRSNRALEESNRQLVQATERAGELADRAERASAAKSLFLANMSHEIRTPIHAVIGMHHLLSDTALSAKQKDYLAAIGTSANALLGIVNDILDFSKMEAGKLQIDRVPFSPSEVVREAMASFYPQVKGKDLILSLDAATELPSLLVGDPLRLSQILNNVLGNAVKFTERGEIALSVKVHSEGEDRIELEFAVRDTGSGISEEDRLRLFQPFQQLDGSITRIYGGTGLGLAICRQLTALMGGKIWCESVPGEGSTFFFRVPFHPAASSHREAKAPPPDLTRMAGRVLLAEDNEMNQMVALELLTKVGLEVTLARDGLAAVELARVGEFDLVLMDVQMPVMDGLSATRAIREFMSAEELPILAMTANAMEQDLRDCRDAGMNGHVTKPFAPATLYAAMARWLGRKRESGAAEDGAAEAAVLDREKGVRQLSGNDRLYRDLLKRFRRDYRDCGAKLAQSLAAGDREGARTLAHSIKGVAGILAAEPLRDAAREVEAKLKEGAEPGSAAARLQRKLEEVLEGIEAALGEEEHEARPEREEPGGVAVPAAELEEALKSSDPAACARALKRFREGAPGRAPERVAELVRLVEDYRYEEALALLAGKEV